MASSRLVTIVVVNVPDAHGEYDHAWMHHSVSAAIVRRTARAKFCIPVHQQRPLLFVSGAGIPAVLPPGWAHFDPCDAIAIDPNAAIRIMTSADVRIMHEQLQARHVLQQFLFKGLLLAGGAVLAMCWLDT